MYFVDELKTNASAPDAKVVTILVDVNGTSNKPNMYGKDIFEFELLNNGKLRPNGWNTYETKCSDSNVTDGKACTARIISDGYKVNYR